jgi:4'-phosphopantetheinyl transferase EntD
MIADMLPPNVACAESFGEHPQATLSPGEDEIVERAVESRRRAFTTARHCARRAMAQLGVEPVAILRDEYGAPCWPEGVVGSITHCDRYRAAAAAASADVRSVGIDAEPNLPLPYGVLSRVALPGERDRLPELGRLKSLVCWDRLLFSAKETIYKAWHPLTKLPLTFRDAEVVFDCHTGLFEARLLCGSRTLDMRGRWSVSDGLLATSIVIDAAGRFV